MCTQSQPTLPVSCVHVQLEVTLLCQDTKKQPEWLSNGKGNVSTPGQTSLPTQILDSVLWGSAHLVAEGGIIVVPCRPQLCSECQPAYCFLQLLFTLCLGQRPPALVPAGVGAYPTALGLQSGFLG